MEGDQRAEAEANWGMGSGRFKRRRAPELRRRRSDSEGVWDIFGASTPALRPVCHTDAHESTNPGEYRLRAGARRPLPRRLAS